MAHARHRGQIIACSQLIMAGVVTSIWGLGLYLRHGIGGSMSVLVVSTAAAATELHPAQSMLKSYEGTAAGSSLDQQLQASRKTVQAEVTLHMVHQQLAGARLPKGVSLEAAQRLLYSKQLLQHSLQTGHAAARAASISKHFPMAAGSSSVVPAAGAATSAATRGILIVGGSRTHLANAYILLTVLRERLRCNLPVEVVFYGEEELDPAAAALITDFAGRQARAGAAAITIIDGKAVHQQHLAPLHPHPEVKLTGWVAKIHAICWVTTFWQVLYLDSDNLPLQDPAILFNSKQFKQHGFMIWPDFWHDLWMQPAVYRLLGLAVPWEADPTALAAESGQLLFDRARHHDVLEWLWMINAHAELVYKCVVGDKDTFRMAFSLAGKADHYAQVGGAPRALLGDAGTLKNRFYHLGMGQATPDGQALMFLHRTARGKYFPWCAARGWLGARCRPAWVTLPATQQQLTASARDAGNMRFDAETIDTAWYLQHCQTACNSTVSAGGGRGARNNSSSSSSIKVAVDGRGSKLVMERQHNRAARSSSSSWAMPLPICGNYSVGQHLPIPAFAVAAIPRLQEYMAAVDAVFEQLHSILDVPSMDRIKVWLNILKA